VFICSSWGNRGNTLENGSLGEQPFWGVTSKIDTLAARLEVECWGWKCREVEILEVAVRAPAWQCLWHVAAALTPTLQPG